MAVRLRDPQPLIADLTWGRERGRRLFEQAVDYRRDLRVPVVVVAEAMGVRDTVVNRLEHRQLDPRLSTFLRYMRVLDLDLAIVLQKGRTA